MQKVDKIFFYVFPNMEFLLLRGIYLSVYPALSAFFHLILVMS